MQKYLGLFIVVLFAVSTSACVTTVRSMPEFDAALNKAKVSAVLPAKAEVYISNDRMYDYESHIENLITDILSTKLAYKGYRTKPISKIYLRKDKLYQDFDRLNAKYTEQVKEMYTTLQKNQDDAFASNNNVGKDFIKSADKYGSNIVVLSQYGEVIQSSGEKAISFMVDIVSTALTGSSANLGGNVENATLTISFVNLATGEILWSNRHILVENIISAGINTLYSDEEVDKDKVTKLVEGVLAELPDRDKL